MCENNEYLLGFLHQITSNISISAPVHALGCFNLDSTIQLPTYFISRQKQGLKTTYSATYLP